MGRFFLTLAWIILLLLLVDSAMNDPDVHPVVERQVQRVDSLVVRFSDWIRGARVSVRDRFSGAAEACLATTSLGWYFGTMQPVARARADLAKLSPAVAAFDALRPDARHLVRWRP